jgi:hypothetical protein
VTNGRHALNKVAWDAHQGKNLATGGSDGHVYVYEAASEVNRRRKRDLVV